MLSYLSESENRKEICLRFLQREDPIHIIESNVHFKSSDIWFSYKKAVNPPTGYLP